jgi:hypothetical protein
MKRPGELMLQDAKSKCAESKPRRGYFCVDIECTGNTANDICFAIGWAYGHDDVIAGKGHSCFQLNPRDTEHARTHEFPTWGDDEIKALWERMGWEVFTYEDFWSKNMSTLKLLQDHEIGKLYLTEHAMVADLDSALTLAESMYPDGLSVTSDTTCFDTVKLCNLLEKHGFQNLGYTREGKYRGRATHVGSLSRGAYGLSGLSTEKPWEDDPIYLGYFSCVAERIPHDHNPENDAASILQTVFAIDRVQRCKASGEWPWKASFVDEDEKKDQQ